MDHSDSSDSSHSHSDSLSHQLARMRAPSGNLGKDEEESLVLRIKKAIISSPAQENREETMRSARELRDSAPEAQEKREESATRKRSRPRTSGEDVDET